MVGLGWYTSQKLRSNGLTSEVPVVCLDKTSKHYYTKNLPVVETSNQPVPHTTGWIDQFNFSQNLVGIELLSGQVCAKALPYIAPMVVRALYLGDYSASCDHKILVN